MERDRHCVYVTDSIALAEVIVAHLENLGIPARMMDFSTLGGISGMEGLSGVGDPNEAIQIWVTNESQVGEARRLMDEYDRERADRKAAHAHDFIKATCEECGTESSFPGEKRGGVDECPKCGAYIDIPDPGNERSAAEEGAEG